MTSKVPGAKATIQRTGAVHIPLLHFHFHWLALHVLGMRIGPG